MGKVKILDPCLYPHTATPCHEIPTAYKNTNEIITAYQHTKTGLQTQSVPD